MATVTISVSTNVYWCPMCEAEHRTYPCVQGDRLSHWCSGCHQWLIEYRRVEGRTQRKGVRRAPGLLQLEVS